MSALQVQILAEAKSEFQKYRATASFDENYIRNLKSQIDTRDSDLRRTLEGYMDASHAKDRLQQEVADRERALQEDRLRGFQEFESMRRNHEFYFDEFSMTQSQENQKTINNLMNRVRVLQCEINYMHDSEDFKDAESMHSQ